MAQKLFWTCDSASILLLILLKFHVIAGSLVSSKPVRLATYPYFSSSFFFPLFSFVRGSEVAPAKLMKPETE